MPRFLRTSLPVLMGASVLLQPSPASPATGGADQVVSSINAIRASYGEAPLALDPGLSGVAQWWSGELAAGGSVSHDPDLPAMAPAGWGIIGENVGRGAGPAAVEAAFAASAEHLANMVNPSFAAVGIGLTESGSVLYVVEDFGGSYGRPAASTGPAIFRAAAPTPTGSGYWVASLGGVVWAFGDAPLLGSITGRLNQPIVGMAPTPSGQGYWLVASDGGIFSFGDAGFYGSTGGLRLNRPIVGMAPTPSGHGYWLVASDGGVFTFGDAGFLGSLGGLRLNRPVVGMATTPSGHGYWLVASDGGIFAFGDAGFLGSLGGLRLNEPVVAMAATPSGRGYWLAAADGGIFTFGDAPYDGSAAGRPLGGPAQALAATADGYWVLSATGAVVAFGGAPPLGSPA